MTSSPGVGTGVEQAGRLVPADVQAVLALVARATDADGVAPLSEHVLLHLRTGGQEPGRHLLVRAEASDQTADQASDQAADQTADQASDQTAGRAAAERAGGVVGYAHLDPTDPVEGASAELVVDPDHRRRGHGRRLVESLLETAATLGDGRLRLWAHGEAPDAGALATAMGFDRARELWQMRRSLYASLPRAEVPAGVVLRTFRPGDEDAVLAVNASAFAAHPEQGRWTRADVDARVAEDWFDPEGLFLAERADGGPDDGELLAFHWTKVHGATHHRHGDGSEHGHDPIGEVYVVGVSPAAQGRGLGRLVTLVGLRHMRERGIGQAMLYVDADNTAAVKTYTALGFARWDVDVQYRRQV